MEKCRYCGRILTHDTEWTRKGYCNGMCYSLDSNRRKEKCFLDGNKCDKDKCRFWIKEEQRCDEERARKLYEILLKYKRWEHERYG